MTDPDPVTPKFRQSLPQWPSAVATTRSEQSRCQSCSTRSGGRSGVLVGMRGEHLLAVEHPYGVPIPTPPLDREPNCRLWGARHPQGDRYIPFTARALDFEDQARRVLGNKPTSECHPSPVAVAPVRLDLLRRGFRGVRPEKSRCGVRRRHRDPGWLTGPNPQADLRPQKSVVPRANLERNAIRAGRRERYIAEDRGIGSGLSVDRNHPGAIKRC